MSLVVRTLEAEGAQRWNDFVEHCDGATFFHRAEWRRVLAQAFGHRTYFLFAEQDGEIQGILPMAQVNSLLFGNTLASLPFCVYGGIAAISEAAEKTLRQAACDLAESLGVSALEFRDRHESVSEWPKKDLYYTFRRTIVPDNELNLKSIPNRQRAMVRKGIKGGLYSEEVTDSSRLYRVYSESVRNLGTPIFSRRYFEILLQEFGDDCRILMIQQHDTDVAGVLSFYFKNEVLPYYGGSVSRARDIPGCNHFMYWELLRRSADEGITLFDFGRSKTGTGPFSFKKNWGFEPQALPYQYYLVKGAEIPNVTPANPKYAFFVNSWKRLPLPVANFVGPFIARNLG